MTTYEYWVDLDDGTVKIGEVKAKSEPSAFRKAREIEGAQARLRGVAEISERCLAGSSGSETGR